jgi:hypothetical protein
MALEETHCYALTRKFLHQVVFPKYPDQYSIMQSNSNSFYQRNVYKPVLEYRKTQMQEFNNKSIKNIKIMYKKSNEHSGPDIYKD